MIMGWLDKASITLREMPDVTTLWSLKDNSLILVPYLFRPVSRPAGDGGAWIITKGMICGI